MEFGRTYCCYAYEQSYRPMHDVSKVSLVVICMTETCGSKSFSSIMSRDISRSPRRQTSWGPSWEEVVEPSWAELSWIDEHNWAVVPRECIIDVPSVHRFDRIRFGRGTSVMQLRTLAMPMLRTFVFRARACPSQP